MEIAWGTYAYGLVAGAFFGFALVFILNGAGPRRFDALMTSLGVFSVGFGLVTLITLRLHLSTDAADYGHWLQVYGLVGLVGLVVLVNLVAVWTASISRGALFAFAAASGMIAILQVALPYGLLVGDIEGLRSVELFGEQFSVHEGSSSAWRPVLDIYLIAVFCWIVVAIVRGYRLGLRTHSVLMAGTLAAAIAFSIYDSLVDYGVAPTPYLSPVGLLGPAIAGAVFLSHRSVQTEIRLVEQTKHLEEIVVDRTAALIESNRRLEGQLAHQRTSTHNLSSLVGQFEQSNAIVDPTPAAIGRSLSDLLARLGAILSASGVELRLHDELTRMTPPSVTSWHRTDEPGYDGEGSSDAGENEAADLSEDIKIGARFVGRLTVRNVDERWLGTDGIQYVALAAEHLAGLLHRLELVMQIADSAVEGERRRIAMELHDSVTQRMYSVAFLADAAAHVSGTGPDETVELVKRIRELVLSSLAELRALLLELRPRSLAQDQLPALLEQLADNLTETCDADIVVAALSVPELTITAKTGLYRICQEALSNACRHSHAAQINIELTADGDEVTLAISDDGTGFDPREMVRGAGLDNLRTRAEMIGAEIDITSHTGAGTTIEVRYDGRPDAMSPSPTEATHA